VVKLRNITDPEFKDDFKTENKGEDDLKTAAIRKSTELKKILTQKKEENPLRYGPFSERVLAVLQRFEEGQLSAVDAIKEYKQIVQDLENEDKAHEKSGLNESAYGVYKILETFVPKGEMVTEARKGYDGDTSSEQDYTNLIQQLAQEVHILYTSDQSAPTGWHLKEQLRKELRQEVRKKANHAGLNDLIPMSTRIEDYALKNYIKVS